MISLSNEQQNAVDLCADLDQRFVSVTGPAGTGKTTILKDVYGELHQRKRISLVAPTGRAAKRIQEATGIEAKTIHRLLEFPAPIEVVESRGKVKFGEPKRNRWNTLLCDVLFIDEASMISKEIYDYVMDALPKDACIRLFGDVNQLPPIETGRNRSIFEEVLDTKPSISLTYNFRSDDSLIEGANRILRGRVPARGDKFEIITTSDPLGALREVITTDYARTSYQVLTPKRKSSMGSISINSVIRTKFNLMQGKSKLLLDRLDPNEEELTIFQDDKILWAKNDYTVNIMNGELGTIDAIDDGSIALILDDMRHVVIPPSSKSGFGYYYDPRKQIDLAYCMTTHKAQGSEFDEIIYLMSRAQAWMLDRNNFYTGVTRAKKKVTVITDAVAIQMAVRKRRKQ